MHDVEDFILPVTTRFQNRASLDGRTDAPRTERAPTQQQPPGPQPSSSSRNETLHTGVTRDDTKFPHAAQVPRGDRKTPPVSSELNSPCGTHRPDTPLAHDIPPVHSMQRDDDDDGWGPGGCCCVGARSVRGAFVRPSMSSDARF